MNETLTPFQKNFVQITTFFKEIKAMNILSETLANYMSFWLAVFFPQNHGRITISILNTHKKKIIIILNLSIIMQL